MIINNKLASVVLLLLAGNLLAEINYGDLPTDLLPPTKWESISSTQEDPGMPANSLIAEAKSEMGHHEMVALEIGCII